MPDEGGWAYHQRRLDPLAKAKYPQRGGGLYRFAQTHVVGKQHLAPVQQRFNTLALVRRQRRVPSKGTAVVGEQPGWCLQHDGEAQEEVVRFPRLSARRAPCGEFALAC